ncbi:hypothetical protein KCU61_g482, partial [Aureobasidium melanogenum]
MPRFLSWVSLPVSEGEEDADDFFFSGEPPSKCQSRGPRLIQTPPGLRQCLTVSMYAIKLGAVSMKKHVVTASKVASYRGSLYKTQKSPEDIDIPPVQRFGGPYVRDLYLLELPALHISKAKRPSPAPGTSTLTWERLAGLMSSKALSRPAKMGPQHASRSAAPSAAQSRVYTIHIEAQGKDGFGYVGIRIDGCIHGVQSFGQTKWLRSQ